jgi:molybdopterin-guanine dinucleotide biosynthesis protein A
MGGLTKAFLTLRGRTFIERILDTLAPLVDSVILATNEPERYRHLGVRVAADPEEGRGPLMGIWAGLQASAADACFVAAADAPLLQPALVRELMARARDWDVVVPVWHGEFEPLCAVYSRRCLPAIERCLDKGRIISFFPLVRVCGVPESEAAAADPAGLSFVNVNTPEDLERLRGLDAGLTLP